MKVRLLLFLGFLVAAAGTAHALLWVVPSRFFATPANPTFGAEVHRQVITADQTSDVLTLSTGISAGKVAVLMHASAFGASISAVQDSTGVNVWTIRQSRTDGYGTVTIATAPITSALAVNATITATIQGGYHGRAYSVCYVTGSAYDTSTGGIPYASSVSVSGTTSAASVLLGVLGGDSNSGSYSYSGGSWNAIGSSSTYGTGRCYFIYKEAAAGSQDPGGAWSATMTQYNAWVAIK